MKIISRKEAKARGLKRYFTGKPCKRGHVAERRCDESGCVQCDKNAKAVQYYWENRDMVLAKKAQSIKENPEKDRARQRRWREKNPERVLANARRWREKNHAKILAYAKRKGRQLRMAYRALCELGIKI